MPVKQMIHKTEQKENDEKLREERLIMHDGFIIYPTYRVEDDKAYVYLYGRLKDGKSFCTKNLYEPYFFIKKSDLKKIESLKGFRHEEINLKDFDENELVKIITKIPADVPELRKRFEDKGISCYESDMKLPYRYMMDKNLKGAIKIRGKLTDKRDVDKDIRVDCFYEEPVIEKSDWTPETKDLRILSIDIETSMDAKTLYCISLFSNDEKLKKVLIISDKKIKPTIYSEWQLYHRPVSLGDAKYVYVIANRIGFRDSEIIEREL